MQILFYMPSGDTQAWISDLTRHLPEAHVRGWTPGDTAPADYALVWKPPAELLRGRHGLKAVFNLGAGVDALLNLLRREPELLPAPVPLIKLDDAGMAPQMVDYVCAAVLRRYRRLDDYQRQQEHGNWQDLAIVPRDTYTIGIMGLGALGSAVAAALAGLGFPVRGWSRQRKHVQGVVCHAGHGERDSFLDGLHVLVDMLPLTPDTENLINAAVFKRLGAGAHFINVARGAHVVDEDLLAALASGRLAKATLDVFREEPLPPEHPLWRHPGVEITPHISALTMRGESVRQIAERIAALERGETVAGIIDRCRGY